MTEVTTPPAIPITRAVFDEAEAHVMKLRVELMMRLRERLQGARPEACKEA